MTSPARRIVPLLLLAAACSRPDAGRERPPAATAAPELAAAPARPSGEPSAADTAAARARITNPDVDTAWVELRFPGRHVERQRLSTLDGTMTITADSIGGEIPVESTYHLAVNGHEILAEEQVIDLGVYVSLRDYQVRAAASTSVAPWSSSTPARTATPARACSAS